MILADTNVWLALALSKHEFHQAARQRFEQASAEAPVSFCRATQQSFVRLLTTDAVMRLYDLPPMTNSAAWSVYEGFQSDRRITWAAEPPGLEAAWKSFAAREIASPKLWMDAYLAAFAVAGEHELVTTDKAFRQFQGLKMTVLARA